MVERDLPEMEQWESQNPPSTATSPSTFTVKPRHCADHKQFEYDCIDCSDAAAERRDEWPRINSIGEIL